MCHLFLILSSGGVQGLDESGGVANEHGVAGGAHDHTEHSEPHICHPLWSLCTIPDAQHVAHGFEKSIGVLHAPCVILCVGEKQRERETKIEGEIGRWGGRQKK